MWSHSSFWTDRWIEWAIERFLSARNSPFTNHSASERVDSFGHAPQISQLAIAEQKDWLSFHFVCLRSWGAYGCIWKIFQEINSWIKLVSGLETFFTSILRFLDSPRMPNEDNGTSGAFWNSDITAFQAHFLSLHMPCYYYISDWNRTWAKITTHFTSIALLTCLTIRLLIILAKHYWHLGDKDFILMRQLCCNFLWKCLESQNFCQNRNH